MLCNYQLGQGIMGRPQLSADRRRVKQLGVRLSAAEWRVIEARAARAGVRPTSFLRESALSSPERPTSTAVDVATVDERRELRRIGVNLNQVARRLNAGRDADVLPVLRELNEWIVDRVSRRR